MKSQDKNRLAIIYKQSVLKPPYTTWSFLHRFWVFQSERIPILVLVLLAFALTSAVAKVNQNLDWTKVAIASFLAVLYLLQIRLSDEPKDYEHDNTYYPKRPVQRGVITLKELLYLKNAVVVGFFILAILTKSWEIFFLAILQQCYSFLTRKEFFIRTWLRAHFLTYQFSHYVQLLILDWLILTVIGVHPLSAKLFSFIFIILMIAMVEGSRTIGGVDSKNAKDRYSNRLGLTRAFLWFVGLTGAALLYTVFLVAYSGGSTKWFILVIAILIVSVISIKYKQNPTEKQASLLQGGSLLFLLSASITLFLSQ